MYFYELHEGDDDVYSDTLLAHDVEFDEDQFLELVLEARRDVIATFEEDTLVEAIANELQRRHGFLHIDDAQLRVAVNVSREESDTFIARVEETRRDGYDDEDDDSGGYRTMFVDVDGDDAR